MTGKREQSDLELADRVRRSCIAEFERGYEEAAIQGLCGEGALEYALDRLQRVDVERLMNPD